jgi:preprotein translocase subunit YajC
MQVLLWQAAQSAPNNFMMLFPMLILLVFMVFFMYIPQNRQRKQHENFLSSLKEGMEVVTNSGIVGRITKIEDKTVKLMVDEKTFMRVLKSSLASEFK